MKPKKKPWIDIHGLRLPDFLKPLLRAGTLHVYDAMQLLGHTVNNVADVMQRNWNRIEEFAADLAADLAKNEDERVASEKQRIASEDLRREQEEVREVGEKTRKRNEVWRQELYEKAAPLYEKAAPLYEKASELYTQSVKAIQAADNAAKSADEVLDKIGQKEYGAVKLTANGMKALIESGQVNNGLKYLVVADNRVVGVYYGKMPQAGCELAVINQTIVGRSAI